MIHISSPYRAVICGGRTYGHLGGTHHDLALEQMNFMTDYLDAFVARFGPPDYIYEGGALGADAVGSMWAGARGYPKRQFKADWAKAPKTAGIDRNKTMLTVLKALRAQYEPVVIGFPGGTGTAHMLEIANLAGVTTLKVEHGVIPVW